jgi:hypothetical protein
VEFVAIRHAVAVGRNIDFQLCATLPHPGVLHPIRLARRAKTIKLAVGGVVLPSINDAVIIAVDFNTHRSSVFEIRAHVDAAVAIVVVVNSPYGARWVVDRPHSIAAFTPRGERTD